MLIARFIPGAMKNAIKKSTWYETSRARKLARTSKRIDICAAQFAHILHLSDNPSLENRTCLEIGTGWVLTHALICHLLGANRVIATDLVQNARPQVIKGGIDSAIVSLVQDVLAPFSVHSLIRARMKNILRIPEFNFDVLRSLGIDYVSPIDLARQKLNTEVDFIYSFSVLEHVPCDDVHPLLMNLCEMLASGGTMIHAIHLEDHKDTASKPFDFLSIPENIYTRQYQTERGNRIRLSEWQAIFEKTAKTTTKPIYIYHRRDKPLPDRIDGSVKYVNEEDLRVSHIGMFTHKG